jgi:hypothetical protein
MIPKAPRIIRIEFQIHIQDVWKLDHCLLVDLSELLEVEWVAKRYMRKGMRLFDGSFNMLVLRTCF